MLYFHSYILFWMCSNILFSIILCILLMLLGLDFVETSKRVWYTVYVLIILCISMSSFCSPVFVDITFSAFILHVLYYFSFVYFLSGEFYDFIYRCNASSINLCSFDFMTRLAFSNLGG